MITSKPRVTGASFQVPKGRRAPPPPKGDPLKGGAYFGPFNIGGLPKLDKSQTAERLRRLADAPSAEPVTDGIVTKNLGAKRNLTTQDDPPKDGKPFDLIITYHFRTALYCDKDCLGYFDYTFKEVIEVTPTWALVKDKSDILTGSTTWRSGFVGKEKSREGPTMGKLQACP